MGTSSTAWRTAPVPILWMNTFIHAEKGPVCGHSSMGDMSGGDVSQASGSLFLFSGGQSLMTGPTCSNRESKPRTITAIIQHNVLILQIKDRGPGRYNFGQEIEWLHPPHFLDKLILKSAFMAPITYTISCATQTRLSDGSGATTLTPMATSWG